VVLNNKGGQIFNWIDGPSKEPKLMPFIETPQDYNIAKLCDFYKVEHQSTENLTIDIYNNFIKGNIQCLEIITN
jgi:2-succinyl-5-enolpyruvyl-6-hydroxy-3-cyclohexene-1-carboxylate synthase